MNRRLFARVVLTAAMCAAMAPAAFAQAPAGRGGGAPTPQYRLAGSARRSPHHLPHPRAAGAGRPPRCGRHPGPRTGDAAHQGRERRLGDHGRPGRSGQLSLQLQRRWRDDDRSAQPVHQRVEQQRLEPRPRAGLGVLRHEERAARRRRRRDLLLHGARQASAACTSTRRPDTSATTTSTRSSTCCTAPATATTRGRRSDAPDSSSTT